jgi:hypothetical protein
MLDCEAISPTDCSSCSSCMLMTGTTGSCIGTHRACSTYSTLSSCNSQLECLWQGTCNASYRCE